MPRMKVLKAYMGYHRASDPSDGALLVFAHSVAEARQVAQGDMCFDFGCEWIDMRFDRLKGDYIFKEANQELLKQDVAHVVDNPTSCKSCQLWGMEMNKDGLCENCVSQEA